MLPEKLLLGYHGENGLEFRNLPVATRKVFQTSAIGKLCYLSVKDNRSKRDKTIYEFNDDRPSFVYNEDYLDFIMYPNEDELDFLNLKTSDFCSAYDAYIEKRQHDIKEEFVRLVKEYWCSTYKYVVYWETLGVQKFKRFKISVQSFNRN